MLAKKDSLTYLEETFVTRYLESGDAAQSVILSGYAEGNARTESWRLLNRPRIARAIAAAAVLRFAALVPVALHLIETFVREDKWPAKVRLDAAKTLLDRAGHVPPRPKDERSADMPIHEMDVGELRALSARLDDEIAGRARDVTPHNAQAPGAPGDDDIDLIG